MLIHFHFISASLLCVQCMFPQNCLPNNNCLRLTTGAMCEKCIQTLNGNLCSNIQVQVLISLIDYDRFLQTPQKIGRVCQTHFLIWLESFKTFGQSVQHACLLHMNFSNLSSDIVMSKYLSDIVIVCQIFLHVLQISNWYVFFKSCMLYTNSHIWSLRHRTLIIKTRALCFWFTKSCILFIWIIFYKLNYDTKRCSLL